MRSFFLLFLCTFYLSTDCFSQTKKSMTPEVYAEWNKIRSVRISDDGDWAMYQIAKEVGDRTLKIYNTKEDKTYTFERVKNASFDQEGKYAAFMIEHPYEDVQNLKRKKKKKDEMPKDTLCIYNLKEKFLTKIPNVKSYKMPSDWGGYIAFLLEPDTEHDTIRTPIKESNTAGSKLIIRNLNTSQNDTLLYAKEYSFSDEKKGLVATSIGAEGVLDQGVYVYEFDQSNWKSILNAKGDFYNLSWSDDAQQLAFTMDSDTTEHRIRPYELYYWNKNSKEARRIANQKSSFLPEDFNISNYTAPIFSKDGSRLIFRITPPPVLQDTALLEEEIVNVEVWNYNESKLYTMQENSLSSDRKKDFTCIYFIGEDRYSIIGNETYDRLSFDEDYNARFVIAQHTESYEKERMWQGYGHFDGYRIDLEKGKKEKFVTQARGRINRSPSGNYCFWYDASLEGHWCYDVRKNKTYQLTSKEIGVFGDEENDRPMDPRSYGYHEFSKDDKYLILHDRYDIWLVDLENKEDPRRITSGREVEKVYRIVDLDREGETTDLSKPLLLHVFDETDKSESYHSFDLASGRLLELYKGNVRLDRTPIKAKNSNAIITTVENYKIFPNLVFTDDTFQNMHTFSNVNPQQEEYLWGDIQLHSWTSETGQKLDGLVVLPENFDPQKKYPLLVNFYERSSDRLHRHRAPYANRSTINYTYYSSKGYVIFNPDVYYRIGYPGQSCYEAVVPGVQSLIEKGYIDEDRIGVQGHSWGGYQIADMLTKTDIFACAEAGAPVVNMVSAYGGIRWGSGMSRMFQYEKTQSRLGATLWERPDLYLENSPIFRMDKMNTPVLILHNDADGAVPWYQGIEYFTALRRLGKPSWMLNYNDEPHWPVKWQNRLDFNIRMEQFFDHYLMGASMPRWMRDGVPAIRKGIDSGLDERE